MARRVWEPPVCLDCRLARPSLCETCEAVRANNETAKRQARLAYLKAYRETMPDMQKARYKAAQKAKRTAQEAAQC